MNRRPSLAGRLVLRYAITAGAAVVALAVVVDGVMTSVLAGHPRLAEARTVAVAALVVAGLLGVLGAWIASRTVARPIASVAESASRLSGGGPEAPVPSGPTSETALIAEALNRIAGELRERSEEARDRATLEQVLAAMDDGVVLVRADDRIGYINPAARGLLRGAPDDLRFLAPPPLRGLVETTRTERRATQEEIETGFPPRLLRSMALPLRDGGNVLLLLRDVTGARRVEAMRRDFVADASHELKTPAASIQAAAETVERAARDDPDAASRFAEQLRRQAERLARIVSDLLDLSRLESEAPRFEAVDLGGLVAEETARLGEEAERAGIEIEVQRRPVAVRGSPKDLRLLVANLLENAIRYSERGGRVRVEVGVENGVALVTVTDTGIGIPSRDLPRIFERFYRVDRARSRATGGTGLGLSIARHVAERHGGTIHADSELGRGSTFWVTLPIDASDR